MANISNEKPLKLSEMKNNTRYHVIQELIEGEVKFNTLMKFTLHNVMPGFAVATGLPIDCPTINAVFGDIKPIAQLSDVIRASLQRASTARPDDPYISDTFIEHAKEFSAFTQFVSNQSRAQELYEQESSEPEVQRSMNVIFASTSIPRCTIQDLFVLPYQHLCRYGLLLDRLKKSTSTDHPELDSLILALSKVNEMTREVNSKKGDREREQALNNIKQKLVFDGEVSEFAIKVAGRKLLHEGNLERIHRWRNTALYFFVFNDIIILTKQSNSIFHRNKDLYSVTGLYKIDEYFQASHKTGAKRPVISIATTLAHLIHDYDGLTDKNKSEFLTAFENARISWYENFMKATMKSKLDDKLRFGRATCPSCQHVMAMYGRHHCPLCSRDVCGDCFNCSFASKQICLDCGKQRGVTPLDPRLVPSYRIYLCTRDTDVQANNMVALRSGDTLHVYATINQRWALGINRTTNKSGCFALENCQLDLTRDTINDDDPNLCLFAAVYSPAMNPDTQTSFTGMISVGDIIAITYDHQDGWLFGQSLSTERFGYVHYSDLLIVNNTELFHVRNL